MKQCAICGKSVSGGVVVHKDCLNRRYQYFRLICDDGFWRIIGCGGDEPLLVSSTPAIFAKGTWHTVTAIIGLDNFDPDLGPWEKEAVNE